MSPLGNNLPYDFLVYYIETMQKTFSLSNSENFGNEVYRNLSIAP
jgi:hypothetical protein